MKFMEDALAKVGSSAENAYQIAEVIIDSELRGSPDHGLYFFKLVIIVFNIKTKIQIFYGFVFWYL